MKNEEVWLDFLKLCQKAKRLNEFKELLEFFLTKEELEMLCARHLVTAALVEGQLTQREISKEYKVSIAQITRGSNSLKSVSPKLKTLLKKGGK